MVKSLDSIPLKKRQLSAKTWVWVAKNKTNCFLSTIGSHRKIFFVYFIFFQAKVSVLFRTAWNHNSCCPFLIVLFQYWRYNLCSFCFTTHALAKTAPAGKLLVSFHVPVSTRTMFRICCARDLGRHAPFICFAGYRAIWRFLLALGSLLLLASCAYLLAVCQESRKFVFGPYCSYPRVAFVQIDFIAVIVFKRLNYSLDSSSRRS